MPRARSFDYAALVAAYDTAPGKSHRARTRHVAALFKCSAPTVARALGGRQTSNSPRGPAPVGLHRARVLEVGHPATLESRAVFPSMVFDPREDTKQTLLKSGDHSAKIGARIVKGPWRNFPIYTLTLEERATCPVYCRHWASCYGNNTPFARRWMHGDALETRLAREVAQLALIHRNGFAVRLHNLGDFYSVAYVGLWEALLKYHSALHVFGYTARIDTESDDIGFAVAKLVRDHWPRFAVRFSNAPVLTRSTITLESPMQKPKDAVICPAQWTPNGKKTESCSTCGLCWGTTRRIAFLQH